jgi:hypothetical protein
VPTNRSAIAFARGDRSLDDPRAVRSEYLVERSGELTVTVTDQELERTGALAELHEQVAGLLGGPGPAGCTVTPRMCTARVRISITNSTYRRWSSTVSTCRKSQARMPDAW